MTPAVRPPALLVLAGLILRLKAARFLLRLANVSGHYHGPHMRLARRLVESAERAMTGIRR